MTGPRYIADTTTALTASASPGSPNTPLSLVQTDDFEQWRAGHNDAQRAWIDSSGFQAKSGQTLRFPTALSSPEDSGERLVAGWDGQSNLATLGGLPMTLPEGVYRATAQHSDLELLGWAMGSYQFNHYREPKRAPAQLLIDDAQQCHRVLQEARAVALARDLINYPAGDMLPSHLAAAATELAAAFEADCEVIVGEDLLKKGYRTIHAVGRAATDAPRLIDLRWGCLLYTSDAADDYFWV
mgnify:CR=1 FL=1